MGPGRKQLIFGGALFLASSLSFAAGYLANREFNHAPIIIEQCSGIPASSSQSANAP